MSIQRTQSPLNEPRIKRMRRMSSADDTEIELGGPREKSEITYYGQSPASLSSQTSWHSDIDHGIKLKTLTKLYIYQSDNIIEICLCCPYRGYRYSWSTFGKHSVLGFGQLLRFDDIWSRATQLCQVPRERARHAVGLCHVRVSRS